MQFKARSRSKVVINITSLIDVIFMMLLFFMITSTFLEQPGIKLDLPTSQSSVPLEQKEAVLVISTAGQMFLNRESVNLDNLEERLRLALPQMKDQALVLKADKDVTHGLVVQVMDMAKRSGVKKLIIGTRLEK